MPVTVSKSLQLGALSALIVIASAAVAYASTDVAKFPAQTVVSVVTVPVIGAAVLCAGVGWGLFVRSRHQLVLALRECAQRAAAEEDLREELAQRSGRDESVRKMHEALGNRLALLSIHAGVLTFRPNTPSPQAVQSADVIREGAHQALEELREVIRVLYIPGESRTLSGVESLRGAQRAPKAVPPTWRGTEARDSLMHEGECIPLSCKASRQA